MREVDIEFVPELIDNCPNDINLMLLGDSGIGKTQMVERWCKNNGYFLKTLILSQLDASEALGVPVTIESEIDGKPFKMMTSAIPQWVIELSQHEKAVLFLDEFLCSDPSVMNSFLNLLSQKRVDSFDLSHVKFIAATNIGMYTFEPDFNILTRFCFFYVVNKTYKRDYAFSYNYEDPSEREGAIFEPRRLVPRCAESLRNVDPRYLEMFYEGFCNQSPIIAEFSVGLKSSKEITVIVSQFTEGTRAKDAVVNYAVPNELLKPMCELLYKTFGVRAYDAVIKSITILKDDQKNTALAYKTNNDFVTERKFK